MSVKRLHVMFDDDDILLDAVKEIVKNKIYIYEVYTPFPVHGLDKAMKLKPTNISIATFIYGCIGFTVAVLMMYYIMIVDWPQDIGGKPSFTLIENIPSFVPIIFEMTVFFAAHLMVITFLIRCGLYPGSSSKSPDPRTTDDKFLMEIHVEDDVKKVKKIKELMKKTGATEVKEKE